jgi:hypothetical protein
MTDSSRRLHSTIGAALAAAFAAAGLVFVVAPGSVLRFVDALSRHAGFAPFPGPLERFWLVLAAAYMYVVTVLAWFIFRRPEDPAYPRLLAHAKFASAALSLAAFVILAPHLILAANAVVDGAIGLVAVWLWRRCASPAERAAP